MVHVNWPGGSRNIPRIHSYIAATAAAAKSLQSYLTLCDPIDSSPRGSPIPGVLQERTLEWVAISFSNAWKWKVKVKLLSHVWLLATPWAAAHQAPPPMGFSRQEYWSGVPLPSLKTRGRRLKSKTWELQKSPDYENINRQELIQKPPYLHWNQAPSKSQQVSEQDIPT